MKIKKNCKQCGKSIFFDDCKHDCNIRNVEYFQSQIKKNVKFLLLNDNRYINQSNSLYSKQLTSSRSGEIQYIEYLNKKTGKIKKLMKILKTHYDEDLLYFGFETVQVNHYFEVYAIGFINNVFSI